MYNVNFRSSAAAVRREDQYQDGDDPEKTDDYRGSQRLRRRSWLEEHRGRWHQTCWEQTSWCDQPYQQVAVASGRAADGHQRAGGGRRCGRCRCQRQRGDRGWRPEASGPSGQATTHEPRLAAKADGRSPAGRGRTAFQSHRARVQATDSQTLSARPDYGAEPTPIGQTATVHGSGSTSSGNGPLLIVRQGLQD